MSHERKEFTVVGRGRRRVDGRAKVTGQTRFADDIALPRMLHCKLLRSPLPHARIVSVDTSRAEASPDVHLVLTGADLPIEFGILPVSQDEEAICGERVRYVGDPVAAVVARDELTAFEALDLIDVDYEPLRTISDPVEALKHPEPRIHDYGEEGNIHKRAAFTFGDVEEALGEADEVFEDHFFFEGNTHLPIEQHASVAAVDPDGKLTLWSSTQTPHYVHRALAKVLQIPAAHIRVIACPNGGGFGGKSDIFNHEIVVCKAALELGRPVKICLTREEVFYAHRGRHPVQMRFRTGVKRDGKITGMHLQTMVDGGGYGSYGVASLLYTGALATVTYHIPRYRFEGCRVFTNKPPCGPKRGHGTPQPRFAFEEVQLDKIGPEARRSIPAELRLKNLVEPNSRCRQLDSDHRHASPWRTLYPEAVVEGSRTGSERYRALARRAGVSGWPAVRLHVRCGICPSTGITAAAVRRPASSSIARGGVAVFFGSHRDRAGIRRRSSRPWWPRFSASSPEGHQTLRHGRYGSDTGRSRVLFLPRDPDGRATRPLSAAEKARRSGRFVRSDQAGKARDPGRTSRLRLRATRLRCSSDPETGMSVPVRRLIVAEATVRHPGLQTGSHTRRRARRAAIKGDPAWDPLRPTPTRAAVLEVEVDPVTGWMYRAATRLDRPRHRSRPESHPGAGARTDRRLRLHGSGRGA